MLKKLLQFVGFKMFEKANRVYSDVNYSGKSEREIAKDCRKTTIS